MIHLKYYYKIHNIFQHDNIIKIILSKQKLPGPLKKKTIASNTNRKGCCSWYQTLPSPTKKDIYNMVTAIINAANLVNNPRQNNIPATSSAILPIYTITTGEEKPLNESQSR